MKTNKKSPNNNDQMGANVDFSRYFTSKLARCCVAAAQS